jgi:hypothetical protein
MTKREGGRTVRNGFYWNLRKWEMQIVPRQGGILPGGPEDRYLKVPVLGLLVAAPVMGALYAFFLPFIGFALVAGFASRKAAQATRAGFAGMMATVSPQWRPGEAHLAGKGKASETGSANGKDQPHPLGELEREIDEQRKTNG